MKLDCARVNEHKEAYVDGTIDPEVRSAIEMHAFQCAACRQKLTTARQIKAMMGGAVKSVVGRPYISEAQVSRTQKAIANRIAPAPFMALRRTVAVPAFMLLLLFAAALGSYQFGFLRISLMLGHRRRVLNAGLRRVVPGLPPWRVYRT